MVYKNLQKLSDRFQIVLGSGSPRRVDLLAETGISFVQEIPFIKEIRKEFELPVEYAERLAIEKALNISISAKNDNYLIIGSDTIVIHEDRILEKPNDMEDAVSILSYLSGKCHQVCTALAFSLGEKILSTGHETTRVFFNQVTKQEIISYVETKEPMDKAGAYGIQGMGAFLVDRIEGNLDNVIGLPRLLLERLAGKILKETQ